MKRKIRLKFRYFYVYICRLIFGINKKKILFESFNGKSYSDNPKAISEEVMKTYPHIQIVWAFRDPQEKRKIVSDKIKIININSSWKYYKELATCGIYVTNFVMPLVPKSKKQCFIQTWHGDRGFKKVLLDATRSFVPEQIENYCNYAIAGSEYGKKQYRSAFKYNGEILSSGTPRNDCFFNYDKRKLEEIRRLFNLDDKTKILLYAPTLRDKARDQGIKQKVEGLELRKTLQALKEKYKCNWVCFVRSHPGVIGLSGIQFERDIIDVSCYEDMSDLLVISDMLITDYSSSAGDFALSKRPIVLFHNDEREYIQNSRELYFDISTSPFYVAKTQTELQQIIDSFTDKDILDNCQKILQFYGTTETGKASETVANIINDWITKK